MAMAIGPGLTAVMRWLTPLIIWWRIAGYDFGNLSQSKSGRMDCEIHWYDIIVLTERCGNRPWGSHEASETSLVLLAILHE